MSAQGDGLGIGQIDGRVDSPVDGFTATPAAGPALQADVPRLTSSERRVFPRYAVDCPVSFLLLSGGGLVSGQMLDLSRGGCRLSTPKRIEIGILVRVEICFQLRGISFRIVGVTAGTRTGRSFAVRFLDMPRRAAAELVEVLEEIAAAPPPPESPKPVLNAVPAVAPVPVAAPQPAIARQSATAAEKGAETVPPAPLTATATPSRQRPFRQSRRIDARTTGMMSIPAST